MTLRFSLLLVSLLHLQASAASDWELKVADQEAGIEVFSRVNEQGYPEFKGVTRVQSRLNGFVALRELDSNGDGQISEADEAWSIAGVTADGGVDDGADEILCSWASAAVVTDL